MFKLRNGSKGFEAELPTLRVRDFSAELPEFQCRYSPAPIPPCYCFKYWAVSFSPLCLSSLSCIDEHLAIDSGGNVSANSFSAVIVAWLNASQRSRFVVGINRSIYHIV